jgi:hypothetical protein
MLARNHEIAVTAREPDRASCTPSDRANHRHWETKLLVPMRPRQNINLKGDHKPPPFTTQELDGYLGAIKQSPYQVERGSNPKENSSFVETSPSFFLRMCGNGVTPVADRTGSILVTYLLIWKAATVDA